MESSVGLIQLQLCGQATVWRINDMIISSSPESGLCRAALVQSILDGVRTSCVCILQAAVECFGLSQDLQDKSENLNPNPWPEAESTVSGGNSVAKPSLSLDLQRDKKQRWSPIPKLLFPLYLTFGIRETWLFLLCCVGICVDIQVY